jgi:hypothetical protein
MKAALQLVRHVSPPSPELADPRRKLRHYPATDRAPCTRNAACFHELRAAYACELYEQLTGHAASVNSGHCFSIDRDLDQQAM